MGGAAFVQLTETPLQLSRGECVALSGRPCGENSLSSSQRHSLQQQRSAGTANEHARGVFALAILGALPPAP